MRHLILGFGVVALPLALAAGDQGYAKVWRSRLPPRPTTGICATQQPKLPVEIMALPAGTFDKPGQHLVLLLRNGTFNIEVIGGGGGGGGAHAGQDRPASGGGLHALYTPISQRKLQHGYYLVEVGKGGAGGAGGWNADEASSGNGDAGTLTAIYRCLSDEPLASSDGGSGGKGMEPTTGQDYRAFGKSGENFLNTDNHLKRGTGGPGGAGGKLGQDGADAVGYGAGGGGQGKTDTQNDGKSHGGRGADGLARLTKIG